MKTITIVKGLSRYRGSQRCENSTQQNLSNCSLPKVCHTLLESIEEISFHAPFLVVAIHKDMMNSQVNASRVLKLQKIRLSEEKLLFLLFLIFSLKLISGCDKL